MRISHPFFDTNRENVISYLQNFSTVALSIYSMSDIKGIN